MKLAAIGNSHLGSLKRGWDSIGSEFPGIDITFFGARGREMRFLEAVGTALVPTTEYVETSFAVTSGGQSRIELNDYDAILIYGLDARIEPTVPGAFYSRQVRYRACGLAAEAALYLQTLKLVRTVFGGSVYLGHEPLLAAPATPATQEAKLYYDGLSDLSAAVLAPLDARLIGQPDETIADGPHTHAHFTRGSKRLAVGEDNDDERHEDSDNAHMNDEFGELWLRNFFAELGPV